MAEDAGSESEDSEEADLNPLEPESREGAAAQGPGTGKSSSSKKEATGRDRIEHGEFRKGRSSDGHERTRRDGKSHHDTNMHEESKKRSKEKRGKEERRQQNKEKSKPAAKEESKAGSSWLW